MNKKQKKMLIRIIVAAVADRRAVSASGRGLAAICVVYGSVPGDRTRYSEKGVERYLQ